MNKRLEAVVSDIEGVRGASTKHDVTSDGYARESPIL
jgi:hypothetical protein